MHTSEIPNPVLVAPPAGGWRLLLLAAATCLLAACGPRTSGPSPITTSAAGEFEVVAFLLDGERDVRRDEPLVVEFSSPVDPASLRPGAIRLLRRRGSLDVPVTLSVEANRVTLHPPEPFGLDGQSGYWLLIDGFPSLRAPSDLVGRPLTRRFRGRFWTSRYYRPGLDPPEVAAIEAREEPGGRYSIRIRFSKPMEASSVSARGGLVVLAGDSVVPGELSHDRRAEVFRFLPRGPERPPEVRVVLSRSISDLLGNPLSLPNPPEIVIPLPDAPEAKVAGEISEDFTSVDQSDPSRTTALWNSPRAPGVLLGEPGPVDYFPLAAADGPDVPVAIGGERVLARVLLSPEELGPPREITGLLLEPLGAVMPAEHEDLTVRATRTLRQELGQREVDLGPSLVVFDGRPWRAPAGERGPLLIPLLPTVSHDGTASLLFEFSFSPGTHVNLLRSHSGDPRRSEVRQGDSALPARLALGLRGFSLEPVATSRFYDSGTESPMYLDPVLEPAATPPGVTLALSFQGALRLGPDGGPLDEPGATSEWTDHVGSLSGYRYLRFRVVFRGVGFASEEAVLDDLRIPFRR